MEQPSVYRTRQGEQVAACLLAQRDPVTAAGLHAALLEQGMRIGLTTVYRHLDRLVAAGRVKKLIPGDGDSIRYQCAQSGDPEQFYLKCEDCGMLSPLRCELAGELRRHIRDDHGFSCNPDKSILYGTCKSCSGR